MKSSLNPGENIPAPTLSLLKGVSPEYFHYQDSDRELFRNKLRSFVPPDAFDVHAHIYDIRHILPVSDGNTPSLIMDAASAEIDHRQLLSCMEQWMEDRVVRNGLYFPFPARNLNCPESNEFLAKAIRNSPGSRGLMMVSPDDNPADVEAQLTRHGFVGFKVYHVFAHRQETFQAEQGEFLPEWLWEIADRRGLAIMMHMVLSRALSDPRNLSYIRRSCLRYPNARLILAHAARGFNAGHTVDAIDGLRGLPNVYFDTSAVCEPTAMEAIIRAFGVTRLMYGSDFPVSECRGRSLSVGDGFFWIYDNNTEWSGWLHASPQLIGLESLLSVRQACRTMHLTDSDVERIFRTNAMELLGMHQADTEIVQDQYRHAKSLIPGGTQLLSKRPEMFAPEQWPAYFEQAIGCEVIDTAGRRLIDMSHCGILSCILGFADPDVNAAVIRRVTLGNMATQQTRDEVQLAELLTEIHPWADQARFARCGGESMSVAVRIARTATGKNRIAVCGYHGWQDWYLAANLPSRSPSGTPAESTSHRKLDEHLLPGLQPAGVPEGLAGTVVTFRYNQLEELDRAIAECGDDLAAIVMEPTRSTDPQQGFLEGVRERATRLGIPLIFDEISSGWRLCLGGAHRLYGVDPDIAVFAKALGNGFAMGAVIGRREVMQAAQDSFISSTFWTEGVGPAAAVACIRKMMRVNVPAHLAEMGSLVMEGWKNLAARHNLRVNIGGRPASCSLSFAHPQSAAIMTLMTTRMLEHGYLVAASCSLTMAHQKHHVEGYLHALDQVFAEIAEAIAADDIMARLKGPVKHSAFSRLVD
ncbi:MAG: aminotransferase class III-fold pyridoxal phosphate-dependent enzyme [Planctomyces sp.]|jgi:glutamate-1-semialdehyde 2,1-aminomutase